MPTPKTVINEPVIVADKDDLTIVDEAVDTNDNDEPYADASGDSEDETPDENEAPEVWHKGEQ